MIGIELDRLARRVRDMNERIAAIEAWARGLPDHPMPSGPAEEQPAIVAQAKDGPAAQAGLPAAEVAVTTENLDKLGRFSPIGIKGGGAMMDYQQDRGHWLNRDHVLWSAKQDIRANLSRVQAEHAREREDDRRRIEELEKRLKTERAMKTELRDSVKAARPAVDVDGLAKAFEYVLEMRSHLCDDPRRTYVARDLAETAAEFMGKNGGRL